MIAPHRFSLIGRVPEVKAGAVPAAVHAQPLAVVTRIIPKVGHRGPRLSLSAVPDLRRACALLPAPLPTHRSFSLIGRAPLGIPVYALQRTHGFSYAASVRVSRLSPMILGVREVHVLLMLFNRPRRFF